MGIVTVIKNFQNQ